MFHAPKKMWNEGFYLLISKRPHKMKPY